MSISKVLKEQRVLGKPSRAGLRLFILWTVFMLAGCYPAPYREVFSTHTPKYR